MKFIVGNLHTGRLGWIIGPEAFAAALHTTKRGTGEFKWPKLKTESDH